MRIAALLLLLLLPQAPGVRIEGVVLQGETDRPVVSAQVQIAGLRSTTDSQGRFVFSSVPAGRHMLLADKDGFMRARPTGRTLPGNSGIPLVVAPEHPPASLVLRLFPAAVITGRVYDATGQPVRNVFVVPYRQTYDAAGHPALQPLKVNRSTFVGTRETMQILVFAPDQRVDDPYDRTSNIARARTNDLGEFRIFNLDPGRYAIYFDPSSNVDLPVFYPGVTDSAQATSIEVKSGEEFRLNNVTLPPQSGGTLRVRINNQSGETNALKFVEVRRKGSPEMVRWQSGGSDPVLVMGKLPPGLYEVEANVQVASPAGLLLAAGHQDLTMTDSDVELEVTVPRSPPLIIRALQALQPVSGVRLSLSSDTVLRNTPFAVTTAADGAALLRGLPAGMFRISILSGMPANKCVTSILQGDRNVLKDGLQIERDNVEVRVTLGESQAAIKGTATDGNGARVPGATIVLVPNDRSRGDSYVVIAADQTGEFEMRCVQPGSYRIYGWTELDGAAYRNADFMKKYDASGTAVDIAQGANMALPVRVISTELN